jgi:hypothetical protein
MAKVELRGANIGDDSVVSMAEEKDVKTPTKARL